MYTDNIFQINSYNIEAVKQLSIKDVVFAPPIHTIGTCFLSPII